MSHAKASSVIENVPASASDRSSVLLPKCPPALVVAALNSLYAHRAVLSCMYVRMGAIMYGIIICPASAYSFSIIDTRSTTFACSATSSKSPSIGICRRASKPGSTVTLVRSIVCVPSLVATFSTIPTASFVSRSALILSRWSSMVLRLSASSTRLARITVSSSGIGSSSSASAPTLRRLAATLLSRITLKDDTAVRSVSMCLHLPKNFFL